jgi:septum site-determining protein MinC
MAASPKVNPTAVFELKSATLNVLALLVKTPDLAQLGQALVARYGEPAGLFEQEALCLDLSALRETDEPLDVPGLLALLRSHGLLAVAARGGSAAHMAATRAVGLSEAPEARSERPTATLPLPLPDDVPTQPVALHLDEPEQAAAQVLAAASALDLEPAPEPEPEPMKTPAAERASTMIIDKPLRSGQRVYARGCDLIVTAVVNFGAEVIADGSIHIYAPLRGRALAGAQGDASARVFAACMEPQLISIAGNWKTFEDGLPANVAGKPAQVRLDGERMVFDPLKF